MENITEIWGKSNFKDEPYSCQRIPIFFSIFSEQFFKVEAVLPYSNSVFLNILYRASANEFSAYGNSIFLVRAILLLLEIISVIKRLFQRNPSFWLVETDFPASGNRH